MIILNVHAPTEDKDDGIKDSFYEELQQVCDQFSIGTIWKFCYKIPMQR
jgi:hypothetical protein